MENIEKHLNYYISLSYEKESCCKPESTNDAVNELLLSEFKNLNVIYRSGIGCYIFIKFKPTRSFKSQMKETKNHLLNLSQLEVILDKLHDIYTDDKDEEIPSVLAVDAATMKTNSDGKKAFFGFEIQPVNLDYKKSIYIEENQNGRFDPDILGKLDIIREKSKQCNFPIIMNATDGDTKTNILHKELQDYLYLNNSEFDERVEKLKDFLKALPVSDLLHLLQSMRRKILRHKIMMTKTSPCIDFNKEREILRMSKYYHEIVESTNPLETMKDNLALMKINTQNLLLLVQNEHYQFFTLLFVEVLNTNSNSG